MTELDRLEPGWEERASVDELPAVAQRLADLAVELERARQLERALRAMTEAVRAQHRVVARLSDEELHSTGGWRPLATLLGHRRRLLRATGRTGEVGHIDAELAALHERLDRALQATAAPPSPPRDEAAELRELASVCWDRGDHRAARAAAEQAVATHDRSGQPAQQGGGGGRARATAARDLTVLGSMLWQLGDLPAAREALVRAVSATAQVYGAEHLEVARCLAHVATVHYDLGDSAAARRGQERALAILESRLGADHRETLFVLYSLGRTLRALGDGVGAHTVQRRAVAGYQRVLASEARRLGRRHPRVLRTLRRLGQVRRELAELASGAIPA